MANFIKILQYAYKAKTNKYQIKNLINYHDFHFCLAAQFL